MLRRDELIKKLAGLNSGNYLNIKLDELEAYVDGQLAKDENIIKMVNLNTQGSLSSGIETTTTFEPTFAVHNDISVKIGTEGTAGSGKKIWNETLQYQSGSIATQSPWNDLIIDPAPFTSSDFNGYIKIELPENTNKNVAYLLAEKYESTDMNGIIPKGGFWGNNNVSVSYDTTTNKMYMTFKLF